MYNTKIGKNNLEVNDSEIVYNGRRYALSSIKSIYKGRDSYIMESVVLSIIMAIVVYSFLYYIASILPASESIFRSAGRYLVFLSVAFFPVLFAVLLFLIKRTKYYIGLNVDGFNEKIAISTSKQKVSEVYDAIHKLIV
ncbi:MAG: DUF6232 family protein [Alphaproteobacteria bacterium]|jgi:hypothetical protein|nr:DUF6232 family protein [Alphaproteobacteria bacterium]